MMTHVEMLAPSEPLVRILKLQEEIFNNALQDLHEEQALQRLNDQVNHINWLLGHMATCRYMLAGAIGLNLENPHGKLYFSAIGDHQYDTLENIRAAFLEISTALTAHIAGLSGEDLLSELPNMPVAVLDLVNFYTYHEAYHLGQIAILRKAMGFVPMKSN